MTQKIIMVQEKYYHELEAAIQREINKHKSVMEIQQINYFSMDDPSSDLFTAFILFKSK